MSELNFDLLQENIRLLMKNKGITQNELAEIAGMTQPNISKALNPNSTKQFTIDQLFRIAQHFKISIDELVGNKAAEDNAISPASVLDFITKLLCAYKVRVVKIDDVEETVYNPYVRGDIPDCSIDQVPCSYNAFYFPDYIDPDPKLSEQEREDLHFEYLYCGNESNFKKFNEVFETFLPLIESYRKGDISDEIFHMVLKGFVEKLNTK